MAAPAIDYDRTARDFDSLDDRLWDLMLSVFPNLTDRDRNNTLNLLRWAFSDAGNNNDYYMSRLFRQAFVPTCTERKWMQILGRRTGYELGGVGAASVDLTITLQNGPLAGDVTIPAGTLIRTKDATAPVIGELQADVVITAGSTSATGSWRHAQSRTYTATSNGLADQEFYLPEGSYIDGSAAFSTVLGAWEEQDTLAFSSGIDRDFTIRVDQNDRATVRTGDGVNGAIPQAGSFTISYEIGGGEAGNVDPGSLERMPSGFTDSFGTTAVLTVTNAEAADGGTARETVNAARIQIPLTNTAARTSTTREDFEVHALEIVGVARALMLTADEASFVPENEGRLYVVPTGGGTPSSDLLALVETAVTETYPPPPTFETLVVAPTYLDIDVVAWIWLAEGYSAAAVKASIEANLEAWFSPLDTDGSPNANVDFGYNFKDADGAPSGEVPWSDIFNEVRDTTGVRKVGAGADDFTLNGARADVSIANHEFPRLGTVTIYNGETGTVI